MKKILFAISLFCVFAFNVNAQTIAENTDNYTEDKFIIGSTRFDNNEVISADKVIKATQNEIKLNVALGMPIKEAISKEVPILIYSNIFDEWYVKENGKKVLVEDEEEIKEIEENLNIFFVNNEEKILEFEYDGNPEDMTNGVTYDAETKKFKVPATAVTFEFKEDGEEHVVYTEPENDNGDDLDYGSFDVVTKENVVATVGTVQFDNLQDALNASTETNPAKLLMDLTVNEILELKGENTYNVLDLGGHTLTSTGAEVIKINGKNNTLRITNGNIVTSNDATLYVGSKEKDGYYNKLIIDKNVKMTAEGHGIYLVGDKSELDFNGELVMNGESNAISGNGTIGYGETIITIGKDAKVTANGENSFAFYLPQAGVTTINGGTFEAKTVIGIKAGELTINGGTFTATGAKAAPEGFSNGINSTGDVILIEENADYADHIKVTVANNATLTNTNGYLIQEHLYSGTNRAEVYGKYATANKLETGAYYTVTTEAAFEHQGLYYSVEYLEEKLNASTKENPVKLLNDLTLDKILTFNTKDAYNVLDLGGHTLTSTATEVLMVNGVNNTLKVTNGNIVSSNDATLYVGSKEQDGNYNKLIVDKNVKMTAEGHGIYLVGDGSELDFNGELVMTGESNAISGNGTDGWGNTIITVGETAKVTANGENSFAFYLPQAGVVTINGGTFEANTVIGIKAGELTINGGTFKATGDKAIPEGYSNGINATGDVIIIEDNEDYADNIEIIVTEDAVFESKNGYYIQEHLYSGANRAVVSGKYAAVNKIDTGFYYTETEKAQGEVSGVVYGTLQEALNNANEGETVTVLKDIKFENYSTTPLNYQATTDDRIAILDLNGYTIYATLNNSKSIALLKVGSANADKYKTPTATLTIKDSSEDKKGTLKVVPNLESDGWYVSVATVKVERLGRLTVDSGNIIISTEGLSAEENPYGIDVLSNTGPQTAELTINGGYIESKSPSGMGVRLSANSSKAAVKFVMNGGEIVGAPNGRGVWFHQTGPTSYHLLEATFNGGKVTADRALELGDFTKESEVISENVQITINGGEFISTNINGNITHPDCDILYTGKSAEVYNQAFNHVKLVDNRE